MKVQITSSEGVVHMVELPSGTGRVAQVKAVPHSRIALGQEPIVGKRPVLKKAGNNLVIEVEGAAVVEVVDFYAVEGVSLSAQGWTFGADDGLVQSAEGIVATPEALAMDMPHTAVLVPSSLGSGSVLGGVGLVALAGGGGAGVVVSSVSTVVSGTVVLGPVVSGAKLSVKLFDAQGKSLAADARVDAVTGKFTVDIGNYSGLVIVKLVDADSGDDYRNEADSTTRDASDGLLAMGWATAGAALTLNVTPLTHIAALEAGVSDSTPSVASAAPTGGVGLSQAQVNAVNTNVASAFGLTGLDVSKDTPVAAIDVANALNAAANDYGKVLAAFAGLEATTGKSTLSTAQDLADQISNSVLSASGHAALKDGVGYAEAHNTALSTSLSSTSVLGADEVAPTVDRVVVTGLDSNNNAKSGALTTGDKIEVVVTSSEWVTGLVSTDKVMLDVGGVAHDAVWRSSSGNAHTFTYTVQAGDSDNAGGVTLTGLTVSHAQDSAHNALDVRLLSQSNGVGVYANDAPTVVALQNATTTLAENTSTASRIKVADIAVTDDALGANVITLTGADASSFEVQGYALYFKANTTLDYEAKTSYAVTVNVVDSTVAGSARVSTNYSLSVADVNEAPAALVLSVASVAENNSAGVAMATLTATDPDGSRSVFAGPFTYILVTGVGDADNAAFNIVGNQLQLNASADFEAQASYSVRLRVTDAGGLSYETSQTFTVTDVNESPTAVTLQNASTSLAENTITASRIKVADIAVTDDALGSNGITLGGADAASFEVVIAGETSALYLKAGVSLSYAVKSDYAVTVTVADNGVVGSSPLSTQYQLHINDAAPPVFSSSTAATVTDHLAAGAVCYDAQTTDSGQAADVGVTYSLSGTDAALFNINATTGEVSFKTSPVFAAPTDANQDNVYALMVTARDGANNASAQAVQVTVVAQGQIIWGDGSGYGNTELAGIPADGGAENDSLSGTGSNDVIFADGSGGGAITQVGKGGGANDTVDGGEGNDLIFGDGFNGSGKNGGYGGGGGGETVWYGTGGAGGIGAGMGWSGGREGDASWLGPTNQGTGAQAAVLGLLEDNWRGGGGVRNGNINQGSSTDAVVVDLWSDVAQSASTYGGRSVYQKILWDLSKGTNGFGTGTAISDDAGTGNGGTNLDARMYGQTLGAGSDVLRGGRGNDWLMGGGGVDTFQWRSLDMDGGTDYMVDFNLAQGDRIDLGNLLIGYTAGADISAWVSLSNGLTAGSPFEGGTGSYSRLQIDREGGSNFAQTDQTIVFRSNALSSYASAAAMLSAGRLVLDNTAPTVTRMTLDKTSLLKGESTFATLTFSEAVTGFASMQDVLTPSGSLDAMSSTDGGITWSGAFTPTNDWEDASNLMQVLASYVDLAGNAGTTGNSASYQVDTRAPSLLSAAMSASSLSSGGQCQLTLTFSEAVTGISNADLSVSGGTLTALSSADSGTTWTAQFTAQSAIANTANLVGLNMTYTDLAGNAGRGVLQAVADADNRTFDSGFRVTAGAGVTVRLDGQALSTSELNTRFSKTTVGGVDVYTASLGQFAGSESVVVEAHTVAANGQQGNSSSLQLQPIDTQAPALNVTALGDADNAAFARGFDVTSGATLTVTLNGQALSAAILATKFDKSSQNGVDSYTAKSGVFVGTERVTVQATLTDSVGNVATSSALALAPIDTIASSAPSLSHAATSATAPVFSGTVGAGAVEGGATVTLSANAGTGANALFRQFSVVAAGDGTWSIDTGSTAQGPVALVGDQAWTFAATQRDAAGNVSALSTARSVTYDTAFSAQLQSVSWRTDRGMTSVLGASDTVRLVFSEAVTLQQSQLSSSLFGSGAQLQSVDASNDLSTTWDITLGDGATLGSVSTANVAGVQDAYGYTGTVSSSTFERNLSSASIVRFNAATLFEGIQFSGWSTASTTLKMTWGGQASANFTSDATGYWSYTYYQNESWFGKLAPTLNQASDATVQLIRTSDSAVLWQQTAGIDTVAPTVMSLLTATPMTHTQLAAGQSVTLNLTLSEDPGTSFSLLDLDVFGGQVSLLSGSGTQRSFVFTADNATTPTLARVLLRADAFEDAAGNAGSNARGLIFKVDVATQTPAAPLTQSITMRANRSAMLDLRDPTQDMTGADWRVTLTGLAANQTLNHGSRDSQGVWTVNASDWSSLQVLVGKSPVAQSAQLTIVYQQRSGGVWQDHSRALVALSVLPWLEPEVKTHDTMEDYNNFTQVIEAWNYRLSGLSGRGVSVSAEGGYVVPTQDDFQEGNVLAGSASNSDLGNHGRGVGQRIAGDWESLFVGVSYGSKIIWTDDTGYDVDNNSWTYGPTAFDNTHDANSTAQITSGRGGLGAIVVFASGNNGFWTNTALIRTDKNPDVMAIASIDNATGLIAGHSTIGEALHLSAPGIGGTSHASPHVAGIAALMLEANPNLGFRDVQSILAYTAHYLPNAMPYVDFSLNQAQTLNGAGLHFSRYTGFGAVNAYDAVRLSADWLRAGYGAATVTGWQHTQTAVSTLYTVSQYKEVVTTFTLNVSSNFSLESVELSSYINDNEFEKLALTLISPSGTVSHIMLGDDANATSQMGYYDFGGGALYALSAIQMTSKRFWGESSQGTWTIQLSHSSDVMDTAGLYEPSLILYGATNVTSDRYVYTDEFAATYQNVADAATQQSMLWLTDVNDGNDSLLCSALTVGMQASLGRHGYLKLQGYNVHMAPNTIIENAFGGDGNDVLVGSANTKNILLGNSGSDVLIAWGNASELEGGDADDWLWVGGNSTAKGGQGADHFMVFQGDGTLTSVAQLNARATDFDAQNDHLFSYDLAGTYKLARFAQDGQSFDWQNVTNTDVIASLHDQLAHAVAPDVLTASYSGQVLQLSLDQALASSAAEAQGLRFQGSQANSASATGNVWSFDFGRTFSGVEVFDASAMSMYSSLGLKLPYQTLYVGDSSANMLDASTQTQATALFGSGGADSLRGGSGADLLVLSGVASGATLAGGTGADTFRWASAGVSLSGQSTVSDFSFIDGDHLDLSGMLEGLSMQSTLDHYLQITHQGSDTVLKFDFTGATNFTSSTYAIVLTNTATIPLDMQSWLNDGRMSV